MLYQRARGTNQRIQALKGLILLIPIIGVCYADTLVSCHDGDTCRIKIESNTINVRFSGIDAPEIDQPGGIESQKYLTKLLTGQEVSLKCKSTSMKRQNCAVFANGEDIQLKMVQAGQAWDYPEYSKHLYAKEQQKAQEQRKGLWATKDIMSPYCWRWLGKTECNRNPQYQP